MKLNTYIYKYPYFIYRTNNDSTIHTNHLPRHLINKNKILDNYENKYYK